MYAGSGESCVDELRVQYTGLKITNGKNNNIVPKGMQSEGEGDLAGGEH